VHTKKEILLVDNDDAMRVALAEELKRLGHAPIATWSGIDALSLLVSRSFDVLLVDVYLPDMYIGDFLKSVSELSVRPKIWVMQAKPAQDTRVYGSRYYSVVEKSQATQVLHRLDAGMNGDVAGSSGWTH